MGLPRADPSFWNYTLAPIIFHNYQSTTTINISKFLFVIPNGISPDSRLSLPANASFFLWSECSSGYWFSVIFSYWFSGITVCLPLLPTSINLLVFSFCATGAVAPLAAPILSSCRQRVFCFLSLFLPVSFYFSLILFCYKFLMLVLKVYVWWLWGM